MKILILGASGMLGHKLIQTASEKFETFGTFRKKPSEYTIKHVFSNLNPLYDVDADNISDIESAIKSSNPDVVVNCIGIVKQLPEAKDSIQSIKINALFPHQVAKICREKGIRFIHISTDCVFSGKNGNYLESDFADADDLYGRTKYLGEVTGPGCLTLRTSIVGRELKGSNGLFEWFFSQNGKQVDGYKKAVFSGLTTNALSEIICEITLNHPKLEGLYHVSSEPVDKYSLLSLVKEKYGLNIQIVPDESVVCDKSLNSQKFKEDTGISIPLWADMIGEIYLDKTPYDIIRR
ncbi:SDR family oxidoreductase [Methanoplanus sp. FWC-SCC4]|uniref:SDR family oxidoreductase n=1 Tax=Methanochimaera problematica TaxID=2609417 RepID=A0AA97FB98_9EURY|nr:SDR family oxidoreductase [Methanoplanus sp. FWC-SCC4]WOF15392.1 SDR family oxidoreductase [Methanoplanus sp. FWC-SCC4]